VQKVVFLVPIFLIACAVSYFVGYSEAINVGSNTLRKCVDVIVQNYKYDSFCSLRKDQELLPLSPSSEFYRSAVLVRHPKL
jgi:hypothetical protein